MYAFGRNDFGQLASGDTVDRKSPSLVEFLRGQRVTSLACGQYHTVVSTLEGGVQSCGKNDYGQLGVEPTSFQINLVAVKGALDGATVRHLRCGYYHTIVLMAGERVFGFGRNDYGQLGLGHITQRVFGPKVIEGAEGKGISKVSAGCYHTVLVGSDGMLYVFGRNHHGQLGTGDTNERHSPFPVDTFLGKHIAKVNKLSALAFAGIGRLQPWHGKFVDTSNCRRLVWATPLYVSGVYAWLNLILSALHVGTYLTVLPNASPLS